MNPLNALNSVKLPKRLSPTTAEEQAAFDKLREQICHPPIRAIPRKQGKYIIDVDASYDQLGCCLLQQQPDDKYLPVDYIIQGLLPAEKNYTVTEIEVLGVVWAVGSLRPYIEGTKFLTRCNHKALKWIPITTACTNSLLNRWRILLPEFDYDVEEKPGPQHAVADALSRIPTRDQSPTRSPQLGCARGRGRYSTPGSPRTGRPPAYLWASYPRSRQPKSSSRRSNNYLIPPSPHASARMQMVYSAEKVIGLAPSSYLYPVP